MAIFSDERGVAIEVEGGIPSTKRIASRLRDMIMVVLHKNKMPLRFIGEVLNTDYTMVFDRLNELPDDVKETYGRFRLEGLLEATRQPRSKARSAVPDRPVFPD